MHPDRVRNMLRYLPSSKLVHRLAQVQFVVPHRGPHEWPVRRAKLVLQPAPFVQVPLETKEVTACVCRRVSWSWSRRNSTRWVPWSQQLSVANVGNLQTCIQPILHCSPRSIYVHIFSAGCLWSKSWWDERSDASCLCVGHRVDGGC